MRKLETCAGYAARSMLEQGAAKPSWGGRTQPGHALLLNPQPSPRQIGKTEEGQAQACKDVLLLCFPSTGLTPPLASGLPGPDHSPSWQQCLVLSMLVVSYHLPLACISPSLSLLPARVGNYTSALPLPHRQRGAKYSPESGSPQASLAATTLEQMQ